jgi:ribonuclease Z
MIDFGVTILGSSSAVAAFGRRPSSQVVHYDQTRYLIDCGEGTVFRMSEYDIKVGSINQIFISHLHGDHYYGLMGIISTYNLNGRTEPLEIFGPDGIQDIIEMNFRYSKSTLRYPLTVHKIDPTIALKIFENDVIEVHNIPLRHGIPTTGYLFIEKSRTPKIIKEKILEYNIPVESIIDIKNGADFTNTDGQVISNTELTIPISTPRKYAYCSDTAYHEPILPMIEGVDLLYHESTYLSNEVDKANQYFHSTCTQAATIATKANVKKLLLGHFSSRYKSLDLMKEEAIEIFENVDVVEEGKTYIIV